MTRTELRSEVVEELTVVVLDGFDRPDIVRATAHLGHRRRISLLWGAIVALEGPGRPHTIADYLPEYLADEARLTIEEA